MKQSVIILILLTVLTQATYSQKKINTEEQKLFDTAVELYNDENIDSALVVFREFKAKYPKSELMPRVHYNIGYILKEQGQTDEAEKVFKDILESKYNDKDPGGHGLMGSQYALYKHYSSEHLADIYLNQKNYVEAEKYIILFDKKHPFKHFGGNEMAAYEIFKARSYAKIYDGQGKVNQAIRELVPHIFYNGLADNSVLIDDLIKLLDKDYQIDDIKNELKKSISTLKIKNSKKEGVQATINLFSINVGVSDEGLFNFSNPDYEANTKLEGRDKYLKVIRTNGLYKHYDVD